jgi:hypothetical protein
MRIRWRKRLNARHIVFTVLPLLMLCSCATLSGGPVEGRVVDADTGKPVSNAVVYAIWEGMLFSFRSDSACAWAESAALDAQGRFRLPFWIKFRRKAFTSDLKQNVFVYSPGYKLTDVSASDLRDIKLQRLPEFFDEGFGPWSVSPCPPGDSTRELAVVYRMMANDLEHRKLTPHLLDVLKMTREMESASLSTQ